MMLLVAIVTGAMAQTVTTGDYTTRTISANNLSSTWAFNVVSGSAVNGSTSGQTDNEMVLVANSSNSNIKYQTSNYLTCKGGSSVYIPVPTGSAGTVSLVMNSSSDSRYFQLQVYNAGKTAEVAGTEAQRLYSKLNSGGGISSDGKKGPQSFAFTSADIITYNNNTYLHFIDNNTEMKVTSFTVTLTTGTYAKGPQITTQPQSASYTTGQTIAALTVVATPATSTYQWYSCDDADKTNAAAIENETSTSYTPTAAGFYYVAVTDGGVTVNSDVAQITISDATAPTIDVTGAPAEAVKVGTEVTLTATATGVPTPTITWYNGSDEAVATVEGTELAYTVPTTTAGTYTFYAKASNGVGDDATSAVQTVVVKEQVATPTFTPNGAFFEESQEVAIASATDGATIQYSTDNGESWNNYTAAFTVTATTTVKAKATKDGYIDSEEATATFTKVTLDDQVDVTGAATWDWSKFGTKEIKLTDQTTPSKTTEFVLSNAVNYGLCASIGSEFGNAQQLKVTTEYVVRDTKYFQGPSIKFNTTVPGKITVVYSNTGNRTDEALRRFLNVNGINYGVGAMRSDETTTTTVSVAAGEVAITGKFGPSVEDQTDQYLRINTITFTPTSTETITIPEEGVATYVTKSALDFSSQNGAFKAYTVTAVSNTSATTAEVTTVPAGTPLLLKGAEGEYDVNIVESASPVSNLLQVSNGTITGEGGNIYAYSKSALKFKKVAAATRVPAGKAYLQANLVSESLDIDFEQATAVEAIAEANAEAAAPVKVIKNGKLYIGNFNVAGQQVK